jgi:hypothetical protein
MQQQLVLSFCVAVLYQPDGSNFNLEESPLIQILLNNSEDKSLVKDVLQKVQKFYFGDKQITFAPDSGIVDVSVFVLFSRILPSAVKRGCTIFR